MPSTGETTWGLHFVPPHLFPGLSFYIQSKVFPRPSPFLYLKRLENGRTEGGAVLYFGGDRRFPALGTHRRTLALETGAFKSKRQRPVAPPALPNPARLPEKQRQPCPRLELLGHICIPFSSPEQHKGRGERQERIAGAGLCQASPLPSSLINNSPWSCVYRDEEGKGRRKHGPSFWLLCLLGAWFPERARFGKHLRTLNLAKVRADLGFFFVLLSCRRPHSKGFFPQKMRRPHPNHPTLGASARKKGAGKRDCCSRPAQPLPDKSAAGMGCFGAPGAYCSSANS